MGAGRIVRMLLHLSLVVLLLVGGAVALATGVMRFELGNKAAAIGYGAVGMMCAIMASVLVDLVDW